MGSPTKGLSSSTVRDSITMELDELTPLNPDDSQQEDHLSTAEGEDTDQPPEVSLILCAGP